MKLIIGKQHSQTSNINRARMADPQIQIKQLLALIRPRPERLEINDAKPIVEELLAVFRLHPGLINCTYDVHTSTRFVGTPLHLFIKSQVADSTDVQTLCELCPDPSNLIGTGAKYSPYSLPVYEACEVSDSDTIRYLCQHSTAFWGRQCKMGKLPFQLAITNKFHEISVPTLILLHGHYCSNDNEHDNAKDGSLFHNAFRQGVELGYSSQFLEFLVDHWPKEQNALQIHIGVPGTDEKPLSMAQTMGICKLLTKIRSLNLSVPNWDQGALIYFFEEMQSNVSIELFNFGLPSLSPQPTDMLRAFQEILKRNAVLTKMTLNIPPEDQSDVIRWVQSIQLGMTENVPICSIRLMVAMAPTLEYSVSGILMIHFDRVPTEDYSNFLQHVPSMRCLKRVVLDQYDVQDEALSNSLIMLLGQSHGFDGLTLSGQVPNLDMAAIFTTLRTNFKLKSLSLPFQYEATKIEQAACLEMLEDYNVSLERCSPWQEENPQIQYYLDLNRFGRADARVANWNELVHLLLRARAASFHDPFAEESDGGLTEDSDGSDNSDVDGEPEFDEELMDGRNDSGADESNARSTSEFGLICLRRDNVVYGLLREAPIMWCQGPSARSDLDILPSRQKRFKKC